MKRIAENGMNVTVHTPLSREAFWHEYAKIPRHTSQNPIAKGDFQWILTRNCEGTEQLHIFMCFGLRLHRK